MEVTGGHKSVLLTLYVHIPTNSIWRGIASDDLVVAPGVAKFGIKRFVTARVECSCAGAFISVL